MPLHDDALTLNQARTRGEMEPLNGFGIALEWLKQGQHVSRKRWNSKEFLLLLEPIIGATLESCIGMKTADNELVPWIPLQTDILAEDWEIVL